MQPLDKNTLFSIFEQGDEEIYREYGMEGQLDNPFVLIGMVIRGLENYQLMDMMYMKRYPQHYKEVRNITKYKYYNKLYRYLNRIDSKEFSSVYKIGESFDLVKVMSSLEDMLRFYEGIEQYEKCAVIKRYQDLVYNKDVDTVA
jgi:hypothetical protein